MKEIHFEKKAQLDFYEKFLPRVDPNLSIDEILQDNNDGVINGVLLEFKMNVENLNEHLFQCIKYLSARRIKGKPVPATILIIDLRSDTAWRFESEKYLAFIEKTYVGGASKNNKGFIGGSPDEILCFGKRDIDAEKLIQILKSKKFTKIHIDENCIVGWANNFYRIKGTARKEDFIGDESGKHKRMGEIRKPLVFADYIYPYEGETNAQFKYLMDQLNDTLLKKNTGAFYTNPLYAKKAVELVRKAIERVPKGNDYIILDRCAGTGILESYLSDEELSHCIVSTIEYYEYKALMELIGHKVLHVIPPVEDKNTFNAGLVNGADALSREYLENPIIKKYLDNPNCSIILYENPPFAESHGSEKKMSGEWKKSYLHSEMKSAHKGSVSDDVGNIFVWSGFKYYLRQPTDSYIVFSPPKYWKGQHLVQKKFLDGFAFNRRHFHTKIDACIMVALWANVDDFETNEISIRGFDISKTKELIDCGDLQIKKIFSSFSKKYYDKRKDPTDVQGVACFSDGLEVTKKKLSLTPRFNDNIIGYLAPKGTGFDKPDLNCTLTRTAFYNAHGFYLRKDNYLDKLPMFAASRYIMYNSAWTERARIMKSADGAAKYFEDVKNGKLSQFLLKCLLFTCLEKQNHIRSFIGSDNRFYRNELCLDNSNGETIASADLKRLDFNTDEQKLYDHWHTILKYAQQTEKYNPNITYGLYQISEELDTSKKDDLLNEIVWDYKELHSAIQSLKPLLKSYYNSEIVPVLFEYEFLK